jgi:septum formation topological specificity factor MinE
VFDYIQSATGPWIECPVGITAREKATPPKLFAVLREEIIAVVGRHVSVDPEKVQVTVDRRAKFSTLAVDIEIPNTGGKARVQGVPSTGDTGRHRDAADGGRPIRSQFR